MLSPKVIAEPLGAEMVAAAADGAAEGGPSASPGADPSEDVTWKFNFLCNKMRCMEEKLRVQQALVESRPAQRCVGLAFSAWVESVRTARREAEYQHRLFVAMAASSGEVYKLRMEAKKAALDFRRRRRIDGVAAIHASLDWYMLAIVNAWRQKIQYQGQLQRTADLCAELCKEQQTVLEQARAELKDSARELAQEKHVSAKMSQQVECLRAYVPRVRQLEHCLQELKASFKSLKLEANQMREELATRSKVREASCQTLLTGPELSAQGFEGQQLQLLFQDVPLGVRKDSKCDSSTGDHEPSDIPWLPHRQPKSGRRRATGTLGALPVAAARCSAERSQLDGSWNSQDMLPWEPDLRMRPDVRALIPSREDGSLPASKGDYCIRPRLVGTAPSLSSSVSLPELTLTPSGAQNHRRLSG